MASRHRAPGVAPFVQVVEDGDGPESRFGQIVVTGCAIDEDVGAVAGAFERHGALLLRPP